MNHTIQSQEVDPNEFETRAAEGQIADDDMEMRTLYIFRGVSLLPFIRREAARTQMQILIDTGEAKN